MRNRLSADARRQRVGAALHPAVLVILVVLAMLLGPTPALASYAYNYSFNWGAEPYKVWFQDYSGVAAKAATQQGYRGYTAKSYNSAWASAIQRNLGSSILGILYITAHSNDQGMTCLSQQAAGAGGYSSMLQSDYLWWPVGSETGITGTTVKDRVAESRLIMDIPHIYAPLVVYAGCNSYNAQPGHHSLPSATWVKGAKCVVGFKGTIYFTCTSVPVGYPIDTWTDSYWSHMRAGWSCGNSLYHAYQDVNAKHNGFQGFDTGYWYGNGSYVM